MVRKSVIFTLVGLATNLIETLWARSHKNDVYAHEPWPSYAPGGPLSDDPKILRSGYKWDPSDRLADCVVAITYQGDHIATGVFFWYHEIMTTASAWEQFTWGKRFHAWSPGQLNIHLVSDFWDRSSERSITVVLGNQLERQNWFWVGVGTDKKHSTVHDAQIMQLARRNGVDDFRNLFMSDRPHPRNRVPFFMRRCHPGNWEDSNRIIRCKIAGFGFVDEADVRDSTQLQVFDYDSEALEDCDEWIPRAWGFFICIANVDNFIGIASGAGLFTRNMLIGVGAFEITKAKDSILVFTDLSKYHSRTFHFRGW